MNADESQESEPLPVEASFEKGEADVKEKLAWMEANGKPGAILTRITSRYPGFQPEGSCPHYERAAEKAGRHVLYRDITVYSGGESKLVIYVLLCNKAELTAEDLTAILESAPDVR